MLTLEATQTLRGVAETADLLTVSAFGDESGGETDNDFKVLYQGQLGSATSTLYTTPASHATLLRSIHVRNTHPTLSKWCEFFVGGVDNDNSVAKFTIPPDGMAVYNGAWSIYDTNGQVSMVGSPGTNGVDGTTWFEGTGAPGVLGVDGDFYLDDATGDVYQKVTGTWGIVANILGPQGDAGEGGSEDHTHTTTGSGGGTLTPSSLVMQGAGGSEGGEIGLEEGYGSGITYIDVFGASDAAEVLRVHKDGVTIISERTDGTKTAPTSLAIGGSPAAGSSDALSYAGHAHGMPSAADVKTAIGIQTATAASGTLTSGSGGDVTITWPVAFANTNYKIVFSLSLNDATNRTPPTGYIKYNAGDAPTTTTCTVRVLNNAAVSEVVTVWAMAIPN